MISVNYKCMYLLAQLFPWEFILQVYIHMKTTSCAGDSLRRKCPWGAGGGDFDNKPQCVHITEDSAAVGRMRRLSLCQHRCR